jgi:hypothetical protein
MNLDTNCRYYSLNTKLPIDAIYKMINYTILMKTFSREIFQLRRSGILIM